MLTRNRFCLFLAWLIIFCWAAPAWAIDLEKKVIKAKLDNGLTILMLERKFSPTVSLYIRHRVGTVDEVKGQSGAAHVLEHMMFKGTTTIGTKNYAAEKRLLTQIEQIGSALDNERMRQTNVDQKRIEQLAVSLKQLQSEHRRYYIPNEIDRLYTENGGLDMNASTGQDVTTYHVSLPANKIELWARIEADRLLNPVFREFYTERDVILEERRQRVESSPDGKLYESFMSSAYTVHPYGVPIIGLPQDLTYINQAAIRHIHQKYLSPGNMVITVVGDINPQKTLKLIDHYFGRIPKSNSLPATIPAEPPQTEGRKVDVLFDASPSMIIGYHKPTAPAAEDYVFDVLETILSKGRTSRLYAKLVLQMQIADSISVHNGMPATRYPNLFAIWARPRHPHTNGELLAAIFHELENIKNYPIPDKELTKAKNQLKMDYIKSLDSNSELASILSYYELLLGDYRYISNYISHIDKVTVMDIQAAAVKYLVAENRTIAVLNKKTNENTNADKNEK
ncbi:MAG: pitrilysin family protein [Smithellaceae bacterium]|nr:pitrilysin family protein [Smithellaceae bacterium]